MRDVEKSIGPIAATGTAEAGTAGTAAQAPPIESSPAKPRRPLRRRAARLPRVLGRPAAAHGLFVIVAVGALAVRALAMRGYPGMLWFGDSPGYLESAIDLRPGETRPSGYPLLLWLLKPFHNYSVVLLVQHLLGVATGVLVYVLIWRAARSAWPRRIWLPGLIAAPLTIPALYPTHQISLEHMLMADGLFTFLIVSAVAVVLWKRRMTWWSGALTGLILALCTLTRSLALPLAAVFLLCMIIRRAGWWALTAAAVACVLPVLAYMGWVHSTYGDFSLGKADGIWLYYRTADFADCRIIKPRPELAIMCPQRSDPRISKSFASTWSADSAFRRLPGWIYGTQSNELASEFAREAIMDQPGAYTRVILRDTFRSFAWSRDPYPTPWTPNAYEFPEGESWKDSYALLSARYAEDGRPRVIRPYAGWMLAYQKHMAMPGTFLGVLLLAGLGGILVRAPGRGRRGLKARLDGIGGPGLLPWGVSAALLVIPAATADFDYRYVLPAVPLACIAAGLAVIPRTREPGKMPEPEPADAGSPVPTPDKVAS